MRRRAKPSRPNARPPIAGKSPKGQDARVRDLDKRLAVALEREAEAQKREAEALGQLTATAEILRVISGSQTDVQPVFDAILASALRLVGGYSAGLTRIAGDQLTLEAITSTNPPGDAIQRAAYPRPLDSDHLPGRAIRSRTPINVADAQDDPRSPETLRVAARARGFRSLVVVPLLRHEEPLGTITVSRREAGGFTDNEIGLLQTFADQAVIAIENVRLFNETKEALEQQTATSEILRVISSSPTNVQPAFEAITDSAMRLFSAWAAAVFRYEGQLISMAAARGGLPGSADAVMTHLQVPHAPTEERPEGRAALTRTIQHVVDVDNDMSWGLKYREDARARGFRSYVAVPMLRRDVVVGVVTVSRQQVGGFAPGEVSLLQTFADQAVIAIENVRLFNETQEALERQTATSEILRVISGSPTDVQPVFEAVAKNAATLCQAQFCHVFRFDGTLLHIAAHYGLLPEGLKALQLRYPAAPGDGSAAGRSILSGHVEQIPDISADAEYRHSPTAAIMNYRSIVAVPMLRDGVPVGCIVAGRSSTGSFPERLVGLLQTFADQAVIAIENVRLFTELQEKNLALTQAHAQVTQSLEQQTATGDILNVISRSPTDVQPVLDTVVEHASRLCSARDAQIFRRDGAVLRLVAHHGQIPTGGGVGEFTMPITRGTVNGRAVIEERPIVVADLRAESAEFPEGSAISRNLGHRSVLAVPLMREGIAIGTLSVRRAEVLAFTDAQMALLQTFADQAVIAIENVRLFNETKEALEQQTATADILRVISTSPTDIHPVFQAIVRSGASLCHAPDVIILIADRDSLRVVASVGPVAESVRQSHLLQGGGLPVTRGSVSGRAFIDRRTVHVDDVGAMSDDEFPEWKVLQRQYGGHGTTLAVPLLREDVSLGVITLLRNEVSPFTDRQVAVLQTFADQAVIAIENVRLFTELEARNRDLTATGEILRVISSSPTDVQPVFNAIVHSAATLCDAVFSVLSSFDGAQMDIVAAHNWSPAAWTSARRRLPGPPSRALLTGRAILERAVVHVPDVALDPEFDSDDLRRRVGFRSGLAVPLLSDGVPVGAIGVGRAEPGPFSDNQVALLKTFADQAVIAIENLRLFTELQQKNQALMQAHAQVTEALEQQTATSEILRVISGSLIEVQPVFDAIVAAAVRLCGARYGTLYRRYGDTVDCVAHADITPDTRDLLRRAFPRPVTVGTTPHFQRALLHGAVTSIPDIEAAAELTPRVLSVYRRHKTRSVVMVPLIRQTDVIGVLVVGHDGVGAFAESHVELLKTFADQAVIAIENVRLFTELQTSNRELTTALDTQTATSDILRTISRSQTDLQPVFDAIVESAVRLLHAYYGAMTRVVGDRLERVASTSTTGTEDPGLRAAWAVPLDGESVHAKAIHDGAPVNIADALTEPGVSDRLRAVARGLGYRSLVAVPLLRHDEAIGTIAVTRREPGGFTDDEIALLKAFADQAVIAIENARLLTELQTRTAELTRSVGELTALGEVGRALSSTLDVDVVLDTIVTRANDLIGADGCTIFEYDEAAEQFHLRATRNLEPRLVELARGTPVRKGDQGILGRLPTARQPVQVPDITDGAYSSPISDALIEAGYRAVVAVPLIREDHLIGALTMNRKRPGEFPRETIELLQTFATQSALAIQNARLFLEIEQKSRELQAASQHKSEFLANMSHELRTPLNAIIGFSEVLAARMFGAVNAKQAEYLQDILESGQHLLSLINDILDLSKVEAGRMELEAADFDLPRAIDNALILVRERASRRGITLASTVDEHLGLIRGDERKVKQVLLNLLSNALKFTPEGGRIDVRAALREGWAEVSVADTGVGIAPEDQEAVFEEFRQVGTADKKVEGTGLGLALSRKFVELHGGRIWVESALDQGSTFTFTLPVS
jgi:GAF domain-containing protein